MATQPQFDRWAAAFKFDKLEKPVRVHLKNVYSCLAIAMLSAAVGGYIHLFTGIFQGGLLTSLVSIGLLVLLGITPNTRENLMKRLGMLVGFAFCSGISMGPLMSMVIQINPSIVPTAFMGTTVIFVCFSLCALLSDQRTWLYLGGTLFSGLSLLMMLSLFNIFLGSRLIFEVNLYLGLIIMCGFILYDTQLIVEKRRRGDEDYIWHCIDLFIDFIQIFRKLMIILSSKEEKKRRN
ncbi:probable Bax inhibitor 1 [Lineus longissimus]|uniref:probable Bax inhibitor 1 n=1 Tax=Lineus longissimus TaxID=88925 RepID=UPI002B4D31B4